MRLQKWSLSLGMIGVISFFIHSILGIILIKGYNPITDYISVLTADGVPNVQLMRLFVNIYRICFLIFIVSLCIKSFQAYQVCTRLGYILLLIMASLSIIGFGLFPMTIDYIISLKNVIHLMITVMIFIATIISIFLLAGGYLKQENEIIIGRLSLITAILLFIFSLMHLFAIINGIAILGLMQRLNVYTFHIYTFILSWIYVFRKSNGSKTKVNRRQKIL
jgi:hypothetical protein